MWFLRIHRKYTGQRKYNKKDNKNFNSINDFSKVKTYIKDNCAYGCKFFILEKENN